MSNLLAAGWIQDVDVDYSCGSNIPNLWWIVIAHDILD